MSRHHLLLLALGMISALALGPTPADAQDDFWALYNRFRYHDIGYSARSAAMGGAYSALQDNENSLLGNPAALGFIETPFVTGHFDYQEVSSALSLDVLGSEGDAEIWTGQIGGAYPLEWGAIGLQYGYRTDEMDSSTSFTSYPGLGAQRGTAQSDGDLDRHYVGLGVGYRIMEELSLGYRFGYLDYDADFGYDVNVVHPAPFSFGVGYSQDFSGHRHQFGLQYLATAGLVLGMDGYFGFSDIDSSELGDADGDSYAIRGGFAWNIMEDIPLLLALDVNYEFRELTGGPNDSEDELIGAHLGAEYEVYEDLFLRAGYQFEDINFDEFAAPIHETIQMGGYTAGFGYKYDQFNFDYAFRYLDTGGGDMAHYFTIGYEF
ncbi:MAG: hypothetical protein JXR73_22445 [Candidatus Omnitrophica bacterium]|nr:hypothetical protein [Candidatus Omnitrophota bacterium]